MMSPIGPYLAEFVPQTIAPGAAGHGLLASEAEDFAPAEADALRLADARHAGFAAGLAEAEAKIAAEAEAAARRHDEALLAERQRWAEGEGRALAERMEQALADLERKLADSLAEILQPFVTESLRTRAAAELRDAIESLLASGADPAVRVSGPADMVAPLRAAFDGRGVEIVDSGEPDVVVLAGDACLRSQLQAWASRLQHAVRGDR